MKKTPEFFDHAIHNDWFVLGDKTPCHLLTGGNQMHQERKRYATRHRVEQPEADTPDRGYKSKPKNAAVDSRAA